MNTRMSKEDICAYLGEDFYSYKGAVTPPIFQNTLFARSHELKGEEPEFVYTRINNPTIEIAEKKIAALEEGQEARCFSSGMGAISAAIMHFVKSGSHVVAVDSIYGPTRDFLELYLARFGVETTFVPGHNTDEIESAIKKNTALIYLESPSSLVFSLQDLEAVAKLARAKGVVTIIDNSYSTPIYQNPIKFGIDLVVHSATKYLGGHSDVIAGLVVVKDSETAARLKFLQNATGGVLPPFDSWLLLRGIKTLAVRLDRHIENSRHVVDFLKNHEGVTKIYYPGLEASEGYEIHKKQAYGPGAMISFVLSEDYDIKLFFKNVSLITLGESLGGVESLVSHPASMTHASIPYEIRQKVGIVDNLIRLSVGIEDKEAIINDLGNAFNKAKRK